MTGRNRSKLVFIAAVALLIGATGAQAELTTTTNDYTWTDGAPYRYTYTYDEVTGMSFERLDLVLADGSTRLVASLISDAEGNWTGSIDGVTYADQYDEALGDYVVVVGADVWPTWTDFDADLQSIGFWDGAVYPDGGIVIDDGIYFDIAIYTLSASSSGGSGQGSTTTRAYGVQNALTRGKSPSAHRREALILNWMAGHGTPSPSTGGKK